MPGLGLGLGLDFLDAGTRTLKIPFLDEFSGAAAAYSLRDLKGGDPEVVRVRRSSDNAEDDFTATEVVDGTLEDWVNTDVNVYTSDFTSGNEDLGEYQGIGTDAETIAGVSDAYKFTLSGGLDAHIASKGSIFATNKYNVTLDYYIPSGQTVDGIQIRTSQFSDGVYDENVLDAWTSVTISDWGILTGGALRIYATDGGSYSIDADGDVFYLKNIVVTQTTADGHVTTWYDQAGSNDATQATAANQPKIVDAGVLVEENGRPAVDFDGVSNFLDTGYVITGEFSIEGVVKANSTANTKVILGNRDSTSERAYIAVNDSNLLNVISSGVKNIPNSILSGTTQGTNQTSIGLYADSSEANLYGNGSLEDTESISAIVNNTTQSAYVGAFNDAGSVSAYFDGLIQELIIYPSDQSSNRIGIETNINNHYNIYP